MHQEIWHFYEWAGSLDGAFFSEDETNKERCDYDVLINEFLSIALRQTAMLHHLVGNDEKSKKYASIYKTLNAKIKAIRLEDLKELLVLIKELISMFPISQIKDAFGNFLSPCTILRKYFLPIFV